MTKDCYWDNKRKQAPEDNRSDTRTYKKNKSNHAAETDEVSATCIKEIKDMDMKPSYKEDDYGLLEPSEVDVFVTDVDKNDDYLSAYIVCLADTGTTSHIFKERNLFTDYHPIANTWVGGVGANKTCAHGRGMVHLSAVRNGTTRSIKFRNVLHVPECKY